jgi:hypothetical protein
VVSALLSPDVYRYVLRRRIDDLLTFARGSLLWVMLNPSVATDAKDDMTIAKVMEFSRLWGFKSLTVVNFYAYRATKPRDLARARDSGFDVVGPQNDATIIEEAKLADAVCCAWGGSKLARLREKYVLELLLNTKHTSLLCVGTNISDGSPTHPCMAAYTREPMTYRLKKEAP